MNRILCLVIILIISLNSIGVESIAESTTYECESFILIEQNTGTVLLEKDADHKLHIASVTKIMTALLIMEAIESGRLTLQEKIIISAKAASMGGSQVYLKEGEELTVDDLLKCVIVASANDATVALAEHLYGSEEIFVKEMNTKAVKLGMINTNFENTNGLDDTSINHFSSARDVAIMSKELLKYSKILDYTTIWMDSIRDGSFILTNTNRLIRFYDGANGLKTGSTSKAGFCISASAKRNDMQLIAVVMGAKSREIRNSIAVSLLDKGFDNYSYIYYPIEKNCIDIMGASVDKLNFESFEYNKVIEKTKNDIKKEYILPNYIIAPINKGDAIGEVVYTVNGEKIGCSVITASESIERITFVQQLEKIINNFLLY